MRVLSGSSIRCVMRVLAFFSGTRTACSLTACFVRKNLSSRPSTVTMALPFVFSSTSQSIARPRSDGNSILSPGFRILKFIISEKFT